MIQLGFGLAVMALTFGVFVPRIADYGAIWDAVRSLEGWQVALLLAAATLNVLTFAPDWMVLLPGLRFRQALEVTMASTAVANVMPAGGAVSFAISWTMFREWGFEGRAVARALILNGISNNMLNVAYPLVAIVLLASTGQDNAFLTRAATIGAVVFVLSVGSLVAIVHSEKQALRAGRVWDRVASLALRPIKRGPVKGSGVAIASLSRRLDRVGAATLVRHDPVRGRRHDDGLSRDGRRAPSDGRRFEQRDSHRSVHRLVTRASTHCIAIDSWRDRNHRARARRHADAVRR
jgi:hypothetical protein